jgi:CBS domain-containing protein
MAQTARDLMTTDVITVTPETPLSEFARICAEDGISGAPVVTVDGRLVGIVTRTDLVRHLAEGGGRASGGSQDFRALAALGEESLGARPGMASESEAEVLGVVDDIMEPEVLSVPPGEPASSVARRMADRRVHRVVVLEEGRVVGILTSLDVLDRYEFGGAERCGRGPRARQRIRGSGRGRPGRITGRRARGSPRG